MTDEYADRDPRAAQAKELKKLAEGVHKRTLSQWFAGLARAERVNNGLDQRIRLSMEPRQ